MFLSSYPNMIEAPPAFISSGANPERCTVLLVDDDPVTRTLMSMALGGIGHEVIMTSNGEEALELVEANPERSIHLLITDMVMPRIGGNELASRLRVMHPDLRILFCSGHSKQHVVQEHPENEAIPFLGKPFTMSILLEQVAAALGHYGILKSD